MKKIIILQVFLLNSCLIYTMSKKKNEKENTVSVSRVLFQLVIYLLHKSPHGSSVLPSIVTSSGGLPYMTMVYMNLQPPVGTALRSPAGWWSLTPPSHPYSLLSGHSLLPAPTVTNSFYFQKWRALCCPDFPLIKNTSDKPKQCFRVQRQTFLLK